MGLDEVRQGIDSIDTQMKELFLKRMDLAHQVIENKKKTGGAVYVPEREQTIISARSADVKEEYLPEYQAFIKQLMGISRTYQYAQMIHDAEKLQSFDFSSERAEITFSFAEATDNLSVACNALALAGLKVCAMEMKQADGINICQMSIEGDFSKDLAKAAILLILEENN